MTQESHAVETLIGLFFKDRYPYNVPRVLPVAPGVPVAPSSTMSGPIQGGFPCTVPPYLFFVSSAMGPTYFAINVHGSSLFR
jgi:hypothetical protein